MASPKIKCGVAGVGSLGQHHARIYAQLPGAELVGIYDRDSKRAAEIAKLYGCKVFTSVEELGVACEAVSVVVPTDLHAILLSELNSKFSELNEQRKGGKFNPDLVQETFDSIFTKYAVALEKKRLVQVGHIEHFNPVMAFLEKEANHPQFITSERLAPYQLRGTEVGVVLDLMIHDIGIVLALVKSPVKRIDSVGVKVLSKTEDIANARIEFENGCVANLNASRISLKKAREIRIFQDDAYLSLDFMNQGGHLVRKSDIIAYGIKMKIGLVKAGDHASIPVHEIPIEKGEPLALELAHFISSVAESKQPKVNAQMGKTALEVALTITDQIKKAVVR